MAGDEYVDDENLDVAELNRRVADASEATSSSCPSAGEWAELFRTVDNVIAVTISSNLSGSYEAEMMALNIVMDECARDYDGIIEGKHIYVLDSHEIGRAHV